MEVFQPITASESLLKKARKVAIDKKSCGLLGLLFQASEKVILFTNDRGNIILHVIFFFPSHNDPVDH